MCPDSKSYDSLQEYINEYNNTITLLTEKINHKVDPKNNEPLFHPCMVYSQVPGVAIQKLNNLYEYINDR